LLYGPPGLGKTTLSMIITKELGVNIRITSGPAIEKPGDLAALLTNLSEGDVLFIDEIHRLSRAVEEILYPAMEDYCVDILKERNDLEAILLGYGNPVGEKELDLRIKAYTGKPPSAEKGWFSFLRKSDSESVKKPVFPSRRGVALVNEVDKSWQNTTSVNDFLCLVNDVSKRNDMNDEDFEVFKIR